MVQYIQLTREYYPTREFALLDIVKIESQSDKRTTKRKVRVRISLGALLPESEAV